MTVNQDSLATSADLVLTQTGPASACVGSTITYQLTLKNQGPNSATGVVLTDLLPAETSYVTGSATAGELAGTGPVKLDLGNLAPGASVGVTLTVRLNSSGSGTVLNSASVTATISDPVGANNVAAAATSSADGEAPVVTVPADYELDLADGQCELMIDYGSAPAVAVDNCTGPVTISYDPPAGTVLGPGDHAVTVTARDAAGNEGTGSFSVRVRDNPNVSWPAARPLVLSESTPGLSQATFGQCLNSFDQSRWYRFKVQPGNRVIAVLNNLPQNYDLVLFKDIQQAYVALADQADDLPLLTAQFAADAFSPTAFSPDAFSPAAFSPAAFSPTAFSPTAFSPTAFSPTAFSPTAFSPGRVQSGCLRSHRLFTDGVQPHRV